MFEVRNSNLLHRITNPLIICCLVTVVLCVHTAAALPGSGTQQDPWRIESLADFDEFAADPNYWAGFTRLETDVNLAGRTYSTAVIAPDTDSSIYWFQGTKFIGVFDGNDHKITNLTIDDGGAGNYFLGLFGYIEEDAQVSNLGLEGASVSGGWYVGGLVGLNRFGSISNCYSISSVNGSRFYVGGMVGINVGSISNCYSTGSVSGNEDVGGLAGRNDDGGTISNCYSTGSVSGVRYVGGLVGQNGLVLIAPHPGYIFNSYSTGSVQGTSLVGGLVGYNEAGEIERSFWDVETSGEPNMCGGQTKYATGCDPNCGKITFEMKTRSTFAEAGWDFIEIWGIGEKQTYPFLRFAPAGDLNYDKKVDLFDLAILASHWLEEK
jgi:hypothetical protein